MSGEEFFLSGSGLGIPQSDAIVPTATNNGFTIRTERDRSDPNLMPSEGSFGGSGLGIP